MKVLSSKIILAIVIFIVSAAAYTYPIMKKGYVAWSDTLTLIEARNKALAGTYSYESDKGVYLSSDHAGQAIVTGVPNPLTAVIYGQIFKVWGFRQGLPLYVSIFLFSLANVFLFLLISRLFSLVVGFAGAVMSILMPIVASGATAPGFYEWALLFFVIGLWLYLNPPKLLRASVPRLILASVFLALAALARNAFAVSFVPFLFYDFYIQRDWKKSLAFLIPFLIIFGSTLTSLSWLNVPNGYTATVNQPFQQIGHVFNDPYSYYFNRDQSIKEIFSNPITLDRPSIKFASHFGYHVTLKQHLKAMIESGKFYVSEFFDLIITGGFFVLFLASWGALALYRSKKELFYFFSTWLVLWLGYLVWTESGNADHFIEIAFIFAVLVGLGVSELIHSLVQAGIKKSLATVGVVVVLFGHLLSADKWRFHDIYRSSVADEVQTLLDKVKSQPHHGVIAIGVHPDAAYSFAYQSNQDTVYFHTDTISALLASGKLKEAFNTYHIGLAIGYSPEISQQLRALGYEVIPLNR